MTVNGGHDPGLFFVYGWRGTQGPFYLAGAGTLREAVSRAQSELARWSRTEAKNVRTGEVVWEGGTRIGPAPRVRHEGGTLRDWTRFHSNRWYGSVTEYTEGSFSAYGAQLESVVMGQTGISSLAKAQAYADAEVREKSGHTCGPDCGSWVQGKDAIPIE